MYKRFFAFCLAVMVIRAGAFCQSVATGTHGMVCSSEPLATEAGLAILKKGGNAYDAAVAVGFALAVTYPSAGNLGGGGFFVGLSARGSASFLDFRETAPAAATKNMFLDEAGNIIPGESTHSFKAVGVPGTVDGLIELQMKMGKLTLADDIRPAIVLAKLGFPVPQSLHDSLARELDADPTIAARATLFFPDGQPPAVGTTFYQKELGDTLQRISDFGRPGFYEGYNAQLMGECMEREGGLITQGDMKRYHCKWRSPLVFGSGGYELITPSLPSSGGVTLAEILGMLDLNALKADGSQSANYAQNLTEAERLAYADRNQYLGDPDFVKAPVGRLMSQSYLSKRKALMPKGRAGSSKEVSYGDPEKMETTHFCTVDKEGNVAAVTYTLNGSYGIKALLPGAGFFLNNEMDDFAAKPGTPNMFGLVQGEADAVAANKRPLSSMTPTIIKKDGRFFATIGSPGGATIITTVLQAYLNLAVFGMDLKSSVDAGRFHHQYLPDDIVYEESAFSPEVASALEAMGYKLRQTSAIGNVNAIMRMSDGTLQGYSDKRGNGEAVGY